VPVYTYACDQGHEEEWVLSIADMERYDHDPYRKCPNCLELLTHRLTPPRRHVVFHEGFFEHVSESGAYCSNMSELKRRALEAGNYSQYAEDLGGLFRAKEGRWV
jgi:predicted nucleic acid-binding Zn ribbon protein